MENFNSKVLLFGEYGVMYGNMALVMPCDRFSGQLSFSDNDRSQFARNSNEYLKKFSAFIASHLDENFVLEVKRLEYELDRGLFFKSNIPPGYGLGSSGALVVAIFLRYLRRAKDVKDGMKDFTWEKVQGLKGYLSKLESFFHGRSSGLDPLSIYLNTPIIFKGPDEISKVNLPEEKEQGKNVVFLLNTGITRSTSKLVNRFLDLDKDPVFKDKVRSQMVPFANDSILSFLENDMEHFYPNLEKLSKFQYEEMDYFTPKSFRKVVKNGLDNGDYFLKICGAGGGGYMLGFTQNWGATREELAKYKIEEIYRF